MQTIVIIFLLSAGALCIVGQIASTFLNAKATADAAEAAEAVVEDTAPKPAAKRGSRAAAAEPAPEPEPEIESTRSLMQRMGGLVAAADAAGARLGVLGLILMLIAVALVVDVSFTFSVTT